MVPKPCVVTIYGSRYQTRSQKFTSLFNKAENSFLHPNSSSSELLSWCPLQKCVSSTFLWSLHFHVSSIEKIIYILTLMWIQREKIYNFAFMWTQRVLGVWVMCYYFCANKVFQWLSSSFVFGFLCDFRRRTRVEKEHLKHMAR
jgi:hypothetical protein